MRKWVERNILIISIFVDVLTGIIIPILLQVNDNNRPLYIVILLLIIFNVAILLVSKKKNSNLKLYETVLSQNIPLYGLAKYLAKKTEEKKNDYINQVHITQLDLCVTLKGAIDITKNNDLEFWWKIKGNNNSNEEVESFNMRIGGDNAITDQGLALVAYECNIEECKGACELDTTTKNNQRITTEDIIKQHTYQHIKFNFRNPLKPNETFDICIKYIWPNCYNSICDFLLIDPNNFSKDIGRITIRVCCDGVIIKDTSIVKLYKLDLATISYKLVTTIKYAESNNNFYYNFSPEKEHLYYIIIEN